MIHFIHVDSLCEVGIQKLLQPYDETFGLSNFVSFALQCFNNAKTCLCI